MSPAHDIAAHLVRRVAHGQLRDALLVHFGPLPERPVGADAIDALLQQNFGTFLARAITAQRLGECLAVVTSWDEFARRINREKSCA